MAFDLHIHTSASEDFKDKDARPTDILRRAIDVGLDGIAVTDHNSSALVDELTQASKGLPIVVFPGTEISVTGGKEGPIHIIALFAPGTTTQEINDLLSSVGLTATKRGKTTEVANGDPGTVIDAINKHGGIPVLAHADSSHGVLHDMKGQPRIKVVKNPHLMAAEVSKDTYKKFLDGTDPEYQRRLPTYEASDAHSLAEIGRTRTLFKVASPTFQGLLQCLMDPDLRICSPEAFATQQPINHPRILDVAITSGFFQEELLNLHACQNCLIGSQGVGKSLLVEFIRFALDQLSPVDAVRVDTESRLAQQLGLGGMVRVRFQVPSGNIYEVTRTFDGRRNPVDFTNTDTGDPYEGDLRQLFPIVAYSQTEAVHISREPRAQLNLIDRFIDAPGHHAEISRISNKLLRSDRRIAQLVEARDNLAFISKQLCTVKETIANIEAALQSPILAKMKECEEQDAAFRQQISFLGELDTSLQEQLDDLNESYKPPSVPKKLQHVQALTNAQAISKLALIESRAAISSAIEKVVDSKKQAQLLHKEWRPTLLKVQAQYDQFIAQAGGDQKTLASERRRLEGEREELESQLKSLRSQAAQFEKVWKDRMQLLDQMDAATERLYNARRQKYIELTALSSGRLMLTIAKASDVEVYSSALASIAIGTHIRKADLALIAGNMTPREVINAVFARDPTAISSRVPIDEDTAQKLVSWLSNLEAQEKVLALQHNFLPQDSPSISYQKEDGNYYPISELSVGQKCTALLIIALSASDDPIVIDQPEEAIDIASVFSDVVSKLRASKQGRQFVLTTHNPNIAVTADSDLIHVLKASATHGSIVHQGAIDDDDVREEVIDHLEGGRTPYLMRGKKYGLIPPDTLP